MIFGFVLLTAAGCGSSFSNPLSTSAPDNPSSAVRIKGTGFQLSRDQNLLRLAVPFEFSAREKTIYLRPCGSRSSWQLERWVDGQWQYAYSSDCPLIALPPIAVTAEVYSDVAEAVVESNVKDVGTNRRLVPGQYRLVVFAFWRMGSESTLWQLSDSLPLEQRASSPFVVH